MLLVDKADLVDELRRAAWRPGCGGINPLAASYRTEYTDVAREQVLDVGPFDHARRVRQLLIGNLIRREGRGQGGRYPECGVDRIPAAGQGQAHRAAQCVVRRARARHLAQQGLPVSLGTTTGLCSRACAWTFHSKADRLWQPGEERKSTIVPAGEHLDDGRRCSRDLARAWQKPDGSASVPRAGSSWPRLRGFWKRKKESLGSGRR